MLSLAHPELRPWLLCLGLQKGLVFPSGELKSSETEALLRRLQQLLRTARALRWNIVHVHRQPQFERDETGAQAAASLAGFEPLTREPIYPQSALSALASIHIDALPGQASGAPIWLAGFVSAASLMATVLDGVSRGRRITVVEDALSLGVDGPTRAQVAEVLGKVTRPPVRWADTSQLLGEAVIAHEAANQP